MQPGPSSHLEMPSFLHGTFMSVARKTSREGQRCGEQYRKDGTFPVPRELLEVPPGEVVITNEVIDFQHERPAWRLYLLSRVIVGVCEALDWQNSFAVGDAYEAFCRQTAWGALFVTLSQSAPLSAGAWRFVSKQLLRFWEPLESARYLFKRLGAVLTLEELMVASSDWAMDAWCPLDDSSSSRPLGPGGLPRMARATREDCIEAMLRQMPRALEFARGLKHRDIVADPGFQRERLSRISRHKLLSACPVRALRILPGLVYSWDRKLGKQ